MKKKILAILTAMALAMAMVMPGLGVVADTENGIQVQTLYAGQDIPVGTVSVWNDGDYLCVLYELSESALAEGWLIYETHLAIEADLADIPTNRTGNPVPGRFEYGDSFYPDGVPEWQQCVELEWEPGTDLYIAAHAVIEKTECELLAEAPYGGSSVVDWDQGLRYDYTPVRAARSNPDAVLTFTTGANESNFFSLGFQEDRDGYPGGDAWIIVEFDYPIWNGPGADLQVIEDTWGLPYPNESANVWVSQNGTDWVYLGSADNQTPWMSYHTITNFDLDDVGLDYARYVKVQDTSNRADFASRYPSQSETLDGFDVNAIVSLQDYQECITYNETAWAAGTRFVDSGNWATYFNYEVQGVQGVLTGTWLLSVNDGAFVHDMIIITQSADGELTGTGGYPAGSGPPYSYPYNWTMTGQVTGNGVTMTISYENTYTATITGTIDPGWGYMSGGAGTGGVTNWNASRTP